MKKEFKISALHLSNLLEFCSIIGVDVKSLKGNLIDPKMDLCTLENAVTEKEYNTILNKIITKSKDEYFGLHYGYYLNLKALGVIHQISLNASSIELAVKFLMEYLEATFPVFKVKPAIDKDNVGFYLDYIGNDPLIKKHLLDSLLCFIYREIKLMFPETARINIFFPEKNLIAYKNIIGKDVNKGKKHTVSFHKEILDNPINKKNTDNITELLPLFMQLLEKVKNKSTFSSKVKIMVLYMCSPELPSFEKVVSQFAVSERTFQRRLSEEGKSFRSITDEIKKDMAGYLRKSKTLKTQDIAYLLGYSEPSAYLHALKKWGNG